jgi:predicted TIM-barrel fold metal-dependent hydrolase
MLLSLAFALSLSMAAQEHAAPPPIIDMHLHATPVPPHGKGVPNPATGELSHNISDRNFLLAVAEQLEMHNIVRAYTSGSAEMVRRLSKAAPGRIVFSAGFPLVEIGDSESTLWEWPDVDELRAQHQRGELGALGELTPQYAGLTLADPRFAPYLELAQELGIPVGVHMGLGPPNSAFECCPEFRITLGKPSLLEPVILKYPRLKLYVMHAGYPWLDDFKALMQMYPQVYADIAVINWIIPRAEFHAYLQALVTAGLGDRLMFGSDQMLWPEAIGMAVEGVESAGFLTLQQKRAIFYHNAARFLGLAEKP